MANSPRKQREISLPKGKDWINFPLTNGNKAVENGAGKPVVLVTGASAGIGKAIAHRFAHGGFDIVALARRKEALEALAKELEGVARVAIYVGDVADPTTPKKAVDVAMAEFGRLDCLINNAGSGRWAPVDSTDDEMLDEVIDISLKGPFRFSREALAVMQSGSSILTVGSVFGILGGLNGGIYSAVKAGLIGLMQTMAGQYGDRGIRSNLVAPGVIRTDMTDAAWQLPWFRRLNHEMTPFHREGTVEDIANCLYFLASEEGSYINGQTIALDGGWSTTKYLSREALLVERHPFTDNA